MLRSNPWQMKDGVEKLGVTEKLLLLALDTTSRALSEANAVRLPYCLPAAVLFDMKCAGALKLSEEGHYYYTSTVASGLLSRITPLVSFEGNIHKNDIIRHIRTQYHPIKTEVFTALQTAKICDCRGKNLKWGFSLRFYVLRPEWSGYRKWVSEKIVQGAVQFSDYWAVRLAMAAGVWHEKDMPQPVREKLAHLSAVTGGEEPLIQAFTQDFPPVIANAEALTPMGKKSSYSRIWEWRGFWETKAIPFFLAEESISAILKSSTKLSKDEDVYLLADGIDSNVKLREGALEVKRLSRQDEEKFNVFFPKEIYPLPTLSEHLKEIFPALQAGDICDGSNLDAMLVDCGYKTLKQLVKKRRFQVKLQTGVKLEFASIAVHGRKFLSVCVEGRDRDAVAAHVQNFHVGKVRVMNYTELLNGLLMESLC